MDEYPGLALYDGGVDDAYENYALRDPGHFAKTEKFSEEFEKSAKFGFDFFSRAGRPHIWPLFPGVPDEAGNVLKRLGAERGEDFYAMSADIAGTEPALKHDDVKTGESPLEETEARAWAESAWRGFGSDESAPESFIAFALGMAERREFSLFHLSGRATGMLFAAGETCGVYYISTLPEFRGRGLGGAVVDMLKARAAERGFGKVTLLATPSGRALYLKHGFADLGTVKIYRSG
ncbi:MAG: GNAT family N-acetyltransferase [Synergistaceae bacterium]|jgi:ribosomal protein S18 acetylase RimI-like enzyme|nr:GNAT family N-acetyltransferase [Synergistaceae bacterium]